MELYGIQQQLARQQMLLEQEQDTLTGLSQLREQKEKTLNDVRQLYQNMQGQLKKERGQSKIVATCSARACECSVHLIQLCSFVMMWNILLPDCVT